MNDLHWKASLCLATLAYIALMVALCWTDSRKKRRRARMLTRLGSSHYFRCMTDKYYRATNLN